MTSSGRIVPSLHLLRVLLSSRDVRHLFVIGAVSRQRWCPPGHPLVGTLAALEADGAKVRRIALGPLADRHVTALLARHSATACRIGWRSCRSSFLPRPSATPSSSENFSSRCTLMGSSPASGAVDGAGTLHQIRATTITDNVVEFMADKARRLPEATQSCIQLAACLGNQFDLEMLAIAAGEPSSASAAHLWPALLQGLVLPLSADYKLAVDDDGVMPNVRYRFAHDRIQQAAASLTPTTARAAMHLSVGASAAGRARSQRSPHRACSTSSISSTSVER